MKIKTFSYISRLRGDTEEMDDEINKFISKVSVEKILVNTCHHPEFGSIITHTIIYEDKAPKSKKKS